MRAEPIDPPEAGQVAAPVTGMPVNAEVRPGTRMVREYFPPPVRKITEEAGREG